MALFGKGKEKDEIKQTADVKEAAATSDSASNDSFGVSSAPSSEFPAPDSAAGLPSDLPSGATSSTAQPGSYSSSLSGANMVTPEQVPTDSTYGTSNDPFALNSTDGLSSPSGSASSYGSTTMPTPLGGAPGTSSLPSSNDAIPVPGGGTNLSMASTPMDQNNFPQGMDNSAYSTKDSIQEMVDETVEKVIEERWVKLVEKVDKVAAWKEKQDAHINMIKEDIVTIKEAFEKLEKRILAKIGDYDKNIMDVNSEIKALEKVFQKITPTLVNNVNELSKIAKDLKEESPNDPVDRD